MGISLWPEVTAHKPGGIPKLIATEYRLILKLTDNSVCHSKKRESSIQQHAKYWCKIQLDHSEDLFSEASDDFLLPFDSELFLALFLESKLLLELELLEEDDDDDRDLFFRFELSEGFLFLLELDSDLDLVPWLPDGKI